VTAEPTTPSTDLVCRDDQLQLMVRSRLGRADELRAELTIEVSLQAGAVPAGDELVLEAAISGPESIRSTTLPVRLPVRFTSQRETAGGVVFTGRMVLTEPAYWTPELPMRYRIAGRILVDGQPVAQLDEMIGLRRLGVRSRSLWLDGRRWVPRGLACGRADAPDIADRLAAAGATAVAIVELPSAVTAYSCPPFWSCLAEADRLGRPLFVRLTAGSPGATATGIARLARHPAVLAVMLPAELFASAVEWKRVAGTMLLAAELPGHQPPPTAAPPGIDLLVVKLAADALPADVWRVPAAFPVAVWQSAAEPTRADCDRLQAELAGWRLTGERPPVDWDWAGFLIG
jgi:hypothetical protein